MIWKIGYPNTWMVNTKNGQKTAHIYLGLGYALLIQPRSFPAAVRRSLSGWW